MSVLGQTAKMVQPNEGPGSSYTPLCAGGPGDMSLGKPEAIPPEISNHEAFLRLRAENQDLQVALEQSNSMLRKRHDEMKEFQETQRREREFIAFKFNEAKNLVLRLTKERDSLQAQLEESNNRLLAMAAADEEPVKEGQIEEEPDIRNIPTEVDVLQGTGDRTARLEQDLQEKLQEAEKQNTQLQEQIQELKEEVSHLTCHLAEQAEDAQRKLQLLAEEKMSVKAQVTSLLGELHESQRSLETSTKEKRKFEESLRTVQVQQREWEAQMKEQVLQLDQHRMQVQDLEAALKMERQNAREEMRKLSQLQSAYHKLFQEYDLHMKNSIHQEKLMTNLEAEVRELKLQLQDAEEALVAKQELIDKLKVETDEQKGLKETVGVLKAQAEIFRADFHAEREARARLHTEKQKLQEQLDELLRERLRIESGGARARIEEMMKRHSDNLHPSMPGLYPPPYATPPPPSIHSAVERQEYCCPKCQYKAPDIDTLQIHVMDCIQ
ncbi:NF-kappa-B essential modulator isoform X6 [Dendropsophus ebraccatus]|uniref:NF-kappa-B essential modulator isoform X6 n=1 Tax=Dendropsophus ebraccatus TaxID=150705 RepID=UPI0038312428